MKITIFTDSYLFNPSTQNNIALWADSFYPLFLSDKNVNKMRTILIWLLCFMMGRMAAQPIARPSQTEIQSLPQWAQEMYGENPNILRVDSLYRAWYSLHTFEKDYHTQYYKIWRHHNAPPDGQNG